MTNHFNDDDDDDDNPSTGSGQARNDEIGTFSTDCPFARVLKMGDATEVSPSAVGWLFAGWG